MAFWTLPGFLLPTRNDTPQRDDCWVTKEIVPFFMPFHWAENLADLLSDVRIFEQPVVQITPDHLL
jgi:hypothetical protein